MTIGAVGKLGEIVNVNRMFAVVANHDNDDARIICLGFKLASLAFDFVSLVVEGETDYGNLV
jgi:hypothetical protein